HADNGVPTVAIDLGRIGVFEFDDVAGELDDGTLQAEADAEEGDVPLAGETDRFDLARDAAVAKAAGNREAVHAAQGALDPCPVAPRCLPLWHVPRCRHAARRCRIARSSPLLPSPFRARCGS